MVEKVARDTLELHDCEGKGEHTSTNSLEEAGNQQPCE
jgi:hypothetical protein